MEDMISVKAGKIPVTHEYFLINNSLKVVLAGNSPPALRQPAGASSDAPNDAPVAAGKWSLSPAFDINPVPEESTLKTAISEVHGTELSVASLIDAAPYFATSEDEARQTATAMAKQISEEWRQIATRLGMSSRDMQVIAPAMENRQIDEALALGQPVIPGNRPSETPISRQR